jgi:hypothetical protein
MPLGRGPVTRRLLTLVVLAAAVAAVSAQAALGDNGDLWLYGTESTGDTQQQVLAGTSPAVAGLSAGGYEIGYQTTGTWRSY